MNSLAISFAHAPTEVIALPATGRSDTGTSSFVRANTGRTTLVPVPEPAHKDVPTMPRRWHAKPTPLVKQLYPRGVTEDFHQGVFGDCYLLAALKAVKAHPDLLELLVDLCFRAVGDDAVEFGFLGADDVPLELRRVHLSKADINNWRKSSGMVAAEGDIVFERAYASLRSRRESRVIGHTISIDDDGEHAINGGLAHVALFDILGSDFAVKYKTGPYNSQSLATRNQMGTALKLLGDFTRNPNGYLITANSIPNSAMYPKHFPANDNVDILTRHAYTVTEFNPKTGSITLADPRHSAMPVTLRVEEFCMAFAQLSLVRLNVLNLTLQALKNCANKKNILDRVAFLLKMQPLHDLMGRNAPQSPSEQESLLHITTGFINKTFESEDLRTALKELVATHA